MTISMYQASVPPFIRALNNLAAILEKGAAHAQARKIDETVLLNSRLYVDMFPLTRQVQLATDTARSGAGRLAGVDFPSYEDKEAKTVTWHSRSSSKSMPGLPYLMSHLLPNIHFHVTTAYAILRHNGVELGKKDFLGPT